MSPALADGSPSMRVAVTLHPDTAPDRRDIKLTTTFGEFASGTGEIEGLADRQDLEFTAHIRSQRTGIGEVILELERVPKFFASRAFEFVTAPVESIALETPNFALRASSLVSVPLTATIMRSSGIPTPGVELEIMLNPNLGFIKPFGKSGADGQVTFIITAGETSYRGPVQVTVSVKGLESLTASVMLRVVDPSN